MLYCPSYCSQDILLYFRLNKSICKKKVVNSIVKKCEYIFGKTDLSVIGWKFEGSISELFSWIKLVVHSVFHPRCKFQFSLFFITCEIFLKNECHASLSKPGSTVSFFSKHFFALTPKFFR